MNLQSLRLKGPFNLRQIDGYYFLYLEVPGRRITDLSDPNWVSHLFSTFAYKAWQTVYLRNKGLAWLGGWPTMQPGHCPLWWHDRPLTRANISTCNHFCCAAQRHLLAWAKGSIFFSYKRSLGVDGRVTPFPGKTFLHWAMSIESIIQLFEINNILIVFRHTVKFRK